MLKIDQRQHSGAGHRHRLATSPSPGVLDILQSPIQLSESTVSRPYECFGVTREN